MKKHFFLFFISLFSTFGYLDTEVESYVDTQHKEIFGFLNNNQELLEKDKDSFLEAVSYTHLTLPTKSGV